MKALLEHLALKNPRFRCRDVSEQHSLIVNLGSVVGPPATAAELIELRAIAGPEYPYLEGLYRLFNGVALHHHGGTFGLVIASIDELAALGSDWRDSFYVPAEELEPYQRAGVAFATIYESGNYFASHDGKVYYSDHDGDDATPWSSLEAFFEGALLDPPKFLLDVGCYTRFSDGKTDLQFIPEEFLHD
jgi:hypothetical protein